MHFFKSRRKFKAAPMPNLPGPDARDPWLVLAPLHAVEIYEAILRRENVRDEELAVWASSTAAALQPLPKENCCVRHDDGYSFCCNPGRDVSYVLLTEKESATIRTWFRSWGLRIERAPDLLTPFGLLRVVHLMDDNDEALCIYQSILKDLGLEAQRFPRSKVSRGSRQMPRQFVFMTAWNYKPWAPGNADDGEQFIPWGWAHMKRGRASR